MDKNAQAGRAGWGKTILVLLAVYAVAALVAGYLRGGWVTARLQALPGRQAELEKFATLAREYREKRKVNPEPKKQGEYIRQLIDDAARKQNVQSRLGTVKEKLISKKDDPLIVREYTVEFSKITREEAAMFLYRMNAAGNNILPAGVSLRTRRLSNRWAKADLVIRAVFAR